MIQKIKTFFGEARQEFKRINWPTFGETRKLTLIVIGLSLAVAVFLGLLDFVFGSLLSKFIIS